MKLSFKNNKRIKIILLSTIMFLGCSEDLLDKENNNGTSTDNFGTNITQIESAINGAFHPLTTAFCWGRVLHTGAFLRSDEFNVFEFGRNTAMAGLKASPTDRWALEPWQQMYKSIGRCNTVIDRIQTNSEDNLEKLVGQAHFLRAFNYWYLLHLYGNVPLVLGEPNLDALQPEQADPNIVRQAIIDDLRKASEMLPNQWSGDDAGRPTEWSSIGLLGKTYLYNKEWDKARIEFQRIVDEGDFSLLPTEMYGENFGITNENNQESLFELQFLAVESFVWGVDIPGTGTQGNYHIDYALPTKSPDRGHVINPWLRDLFESNNDVVRRNETLLYDYPGATSYGGLSFTEDLNTVRNDADGQPIQTDVQIAEAAGVEPIFSKKYAGMDLGARADVNFLGANVGNNWRVIRYSDILLMLAESLNELNRTGEAEVLVNQVRERADIDLLSGLNKEEMTQAIIDERAMELAGEGHRFLDLVRWGLADEFLGTPSLHGGAYHPKSLVGGAFQSNRDELIWIPLGEISTNPNLKPNPGY
ncbi:RagB/SusD family nutrient uptake outer membrane protein [Aquimarina agarilytica]|uniref:RagB/SusD family nutrient uptake outer membrane protein n=1 Tax=Aquimarina agarilytica TaxID=1087449 RepID=UPI00058C960B|nr:RagB/SusD family nutrient uptake outer membrane protein [Aquimarina agarilytica]